jgi:ATP-dependent Clp protease ATP-binding subunit ClpA
VLARALKEAMRRRDKEIGSEYILLGLVADDGDAAEILTSLGATPEKVRAALMPSDA